MNIATFNANSIRSRLATILAWLDTQRPDVLCVQETKAQDADFPSAPLRAAGYHAVFRGMKAYNGVAILSRHEPDEAWAGFDDGGPADAFRLLGARFGGLNIVNTYVPQGREITHEMFAYKLEWFARLRRLFDARWTTREDVLWCGDLNVARTADDVHDAEQYLEHVCFHPAARAAFENAIAWGFTDVFRSFHTGPGHYSFFDYRTPNAVARRIGWRLDYLLASPPLAARCRACEIDVAPRRQPGASDHTFVVADFA